MGKIKRLVTALVCFMLAGGLVAATNPPLSSATQRSASFADTQRPTSGECGFIVRSIVTDLAEQIYFAARHRLPATNAFSVLVAEKSGSSPDEPTFELSIRLGTNMDEINYDLPVQGPLWSPDVYHGLAVRLGAAVGLGPGHAGKTNTFFLNRMRSSNVDEVVRAGMSASIKLEKDFCDAELHEEAASALAFFAFRDHSGKFSDLRAPLSRLTTHLTMAQLLRGTRKFEVNGQVAEAMMLTLIGNQVTAMACLDQIATNFPDQVPLIRAVRARNTGDYRPMETITNLSPLESVELFKAKAGSIDPTLAWNRPGMNRDQVDCLRIANEMRYSVRTGHWLYDHSLYRDCNEVALAHNIFFQRRLGDIVAALNELPGNCLKADGENVRVQVIDWGQWAYFEQRHLCQTLEQNFYFLNSLWGVPDKARKFAATNEKIYGHLRLYALVRRFMATDESSYRKAVDEGSRLAVELPQFVPAMCWNYLLVKPESLPAPRPGIDTGLRNWFRNAPLPGTVYDIKARLVHPSLMDRPDAIAVLERLHKAAPYNDLLIRYLLHHKYKDEPTYDQAAQSYEPILSYNVSAMMAVAETVKDKPERYRELMLKAAELDLNCYYLLSDFELENEREDEAAKYLDIACASDPDLVQVANHALWRVKYLLRKGQKEKALLIANQGADAYSAIGLEAKAFYLEETGDYDGAFIWYYKIVARYDDSEPLDSFRARYKKRTGDTRFDSVSKALGKTLFPDGQQKVTIKDFGVPPIDGTVFVGESEYCRAAGLNAGAVVVALNGIRVHNQEQYEYIRDSLLIGPEMNLIVWQNEAYQEIKASPPAHKFGVSIRSYVK